MSRIRSLSMSRTRIVLPGGIAAGSRDEVRTLRRAAEWSAVRRIDILEEFA